MVSSTRTPTKTSTATSTSSGQATSTQIPATATNIPATPTVEIIETPTEATETSTPESTDTSPVATPTEIAIQDTPTTTSPIATPTEALTTTIPITSTNLVVNPNLDIPPDWANHEGFDYWIRDNGWWMVGVKVNTPSPNHTAAKLGQDTLSNGNLQGWPNNSEDWLSQVITTTPHSLVVFTMTEIQHMTPEGVAEVRIYGSDDAENWTEVWFRAAPDAPYNTTENRTDWFTFTYLIPANYSYYKLEFYGKLDSTDDGWKFCLLDFRTVSYGSP